jgi:hypothetical protein
MLAQKVQELSDGVIREGELYTIGRFKSCLRLTESAVRALRIAGMPVIRFGKRAYVSGRQAIEFLEKWRGN